MLKLAQKNEAYKLNIWQLPTLNSNPLSVVAKKTKPEKRTKRQKKDKNAPKKPMSAFFCYQQTRRQSLKEEAPELNHKDIIRVNLAYCVTLCSVWLMNGRSWPVSKRRSTKTCPSVKKTDMKDRCRTIEVNNLHKKVEIKRKSWARSDPPLPRKRQHLPKPSLLLVLRRRPLHRSPKRKDPPRRAKPKKRGGHLLQKKKKNNLCQLKSLRKSSLRLLPPPSKRIRFPSLR